MESRRALVLLPAGAWMAVYWSCAVRRYLRMPHAAGVVAAVLVMSLLAAVAAVYYWPGDGLVGEATRAMPGW